MVSAGEDRSLVLWQRDTGSDGTTKWTKVGLSPWCAAFGSGPFHQCAERSIQLTLMLLRPSQVAALTDTSLHSQPIYSVDWSRPEAKDGDNSAGLVATACGDNGVRVFAVRTGNWARIARTSDSSACSVRHAGLFLFESCPCFWNAS